MGLDPDNRILRQFFAIMFFIRTNIQRSKAPLTKSVSYTRTPSSGRVAQFDKASIPLRSSDAATFAGHDKATTAVMELAEETGIMLRDLRIELAEARLDRAQ